MKYLFTTNSKNNMRDQLQQLKSLKPLEPFADISIEFVSQIANKILLDRESRQIPELMAAANWMRTNRLTTLKTEFEGLRSKRTLLSRGLGLHFAPSNVDTIFIYSWILSMLLGNTNVIRLSQKENKAFDIFLRILIDISNNKKYRPLCERLLILSYPHNPDTTSTLSAYCDFRVIWGGDNTINKIRETKLPPRSTEVVFSDRFSVASINCNEIAHTNEEQLKDLASRFVNDAFTFGQNACSSPRAIFFVGNKTQRDTAKTRFWDAVHTTANNKNEPLISPANAMNRFTTAAVLAAKKKINPYSSEFFSFPMRLHINKLDPELRNLHTGNGVFFEIDINSVDEMASHLTNKDQTLMVYGFSNEEIRCALESAPASAIDRVIPFGKSLEFSHVWDGYNLLLEFSREVFYHDHKADHKNRRITHG